MSDLVQQLGEEERNRHALVLEIAGLVGMYGHRAKTTGNKDLAELVESLARVIGVEPYPTYEGD